MTATLVTDLANRLVTAQQQKQPCMPLRDIIAAAPDPIGLAYQIQQYNVQQRVDAGARIVGHKIGLTSLAVQHQLGVDSPDYGCLFADMAHGDNEEIALKHFLQPKVEAEIVLVLERDLTHQQHTFADIISATAYALPALEIVDSRIANWDIKLTDTVADNASCGHFVLGSRPVSLQNLDLVGCSMKMNADGKQVSSGQGSACLGNPLNAAIWLADRMVALDTPLRAGDILLTGALGPMSAVTHASSIRADIQGMGSVRIHFTD